MVKRPRQIYIDLNMQCNLKCVQCDIHLLRDPEGAMSLDDQRELLRDIAAWVPKAQVLFSGGEPFLQRKRLYVLAELAAELGLRTSVNTNGTLLKAEDFSRLPYSGLRSVVFSIDAPSAAVHDRIRGVPGTFARVTGALRQLAAATKGSRQKFQVYVTAILGAHNIDVLPQLFDLTESLGSDGLLFQPIQPVFERTVTPDWWRDNPLWPSAEQAQRGIDQLLTLKAAGRRTLHSPTQLEDMRHYFLSHGKLLPEQCASPRENLMIDLLGNVRLCFNMDRLDHAPAGNVRFQPLSEIWARSRPLAEAIDTCALECGAMLCHCR